jgi:hypothetical protein
MSPAESRKLLAVDVDSGTHEFLPLIPRPGHALHGVAASDGASGWSGVKRHSDVRKPYAA